MSESPSNGVGVTRERLAGPRKPLPGSAGAPVGGPDGGYEGGHHGGLQRVLGVPALFSAAYGNVGSSIYYALGLVAGFALGWTPVAFLVSGIIFVCTALSYAEATATFPEAGGASSFARHAFNEFTSFTTAWAQVLNYVITMSISAFFVPHYLSVFWGPLDSPYGAVLGGMAVIAILAGLNIYGIEETAALTVTLAIVDFGTQVLLAILGMILLFSPHVLAHNVQGSLSTGWGKVVLGITVSMIAYTGIETISNMSEETRDPVRSVPRAIGWVVLAVLSLYLVLPIVALSALPVHMVHGKPLTLLGTKFAGDPFVGFVDQFHLPAHWIHTALIGYVGILASVILFIATNAGVIGISRLTYSMAQYRQVPEMLRKVHPTRLTPYVSIGIFSIIGCLLLLPPIFATEVMHHGKAVLDGDGKPTYHFALISVGRENEVLGNLYAFGAMLSFSIAHISVIRMRWRRDEVAWRAPGNMRLGTRVLPLFAMVGLFGTGAAWCVQVATHPLERVIGFAWMLSGPLLYVFYRRSKGLALTTTVRAPVAVLAPSAEVAYRNILVPVLGGRLDHAAMVVACKLAAERGATIVAAAVLEVPQSLPLLAELGDAELKANQQLDLARAIGEEYGVNVITRLVRARAADGAVIEEAARRESQLVVLGVHKRRHLGMSLTGRANERIIRKSPVRVLLVRERDDFVTGRSA
jgi:APA family basic amino acid/polyamine antiporter